ncbi:MAG: hypothetical protein HQL69_20850 [Magnetococcales bacterium]|nr:hypothetical protein [Magnetococcales bacterium]
MPVKYFVGAGGKYLGAFNDCEPDDSEAVEVGYPPKDARQIWNGSGYDDPAMSQDELIQAIKDEAGRRIYGLCDAKDQRNMNAMATRLARKAKADRTEAEEAMLDKLEAVFVWIEAMRTVSKKLRGDLVTSFADDSHWPPPPVIPI